MNKGYKVEDRKVKWSLDHDQCKCIFPGIMAWSVLISLCSSFFFSQSRNWRGRSVSSIPGGVYIAPAVAGCVRFLDLAGRAGFNLQAPTDIYTGCTCVKMSDSKPNVSARDIWKMKAILMSIKLLMIERIESEEILDRVLWFI